MREVSMYQSIDGKLFKLKVDCVAHDAKINGREHLCPKCDGERLVAEGDMQYKSIENPDHGYNGWYAPMTYTKVEAGRKMIKCDVCDGFGYTKERYKPSTVEKVVGYEIDE